MTNFDAGTASAKYLLDVSQPRKAAAELRQLFASIKADGAALGRGGAAGGAGGIDAAQSRAAKTAAQVATEQQRAALVAGRLATEQQKAALVLANTEKAQTNAARSALALQQAQQRAARAATDPVLPRSLERFGPQALDQIKSGLLGVVGPAAVAGAALGVVAGAAERTRQAFIFATELEQSRRSITTLIGATRDSGRVFQEAAAFGQRYAFTQREITDALQASTQILKVSNASTEDTLGALSRLAVLNPAEGIQGAAFALRELASGDVTSFVDRFNQSRDSAYALRDAIRSGVDPVVALAGFLDTAGVSMQTLEDRTQGAAGKLRDLAIQQERFNLALAGQAGGAGEGFLDFRTNLLKEGAAILSGDFRDIEARNAGRQAAQEAYNAALRQGKSDAEAYVLAQQAQTQAAQEYTAWVGAAGDATRDHGGVLSQTTQEISYQSQAMIQASAVLAEAQAATATYNAALGENAGAQAISAAQSEILKERQEGIRDTLAQLSAGTLGQTQAEGILASQYGVTAAQIPQLIALTAQLAATRAAANAAEGLADQRAGERSGGAVKTKAEADGLGRLNQLRGEYARRRAADNERAAREAEQFATRQTATARKTTGAQRETAALFRADLDTAATAQERIAVLEEKRRALEAKGLQNSAAHRQVLADIADEQTKLADEAERANRAAVDARLGAIKDAQQDIKDAREKAGLERQLQSGRFSAQQQDAARLRLEEIALEDQKRALDIARDARTAGLAGPGATPIQAGAAVPVGAQAPVFAQAPAVTGAGAPPITMNLTVNIDDQGRATVSGAPAGVALNVLINKGLSRASG